MFKRLKDKIDCKLEDPDFADFSSKVAIVVGLIGLTVEIVLAFLK